MPYDEPLAERVRDALKGRRWVTEKKMFGGVCFLHRGNMCCGVAKSELMLRLGEQGAAAALAEAHTRPMDFTGRPMKTMVFVDPAGLSNDADLRAWIERALAFAKTLPAKR